MDERSVLMAQIEATLENLGRAERALEAKQIDRDLREAVRNRFEKLIANQVKDLENLREQVDSNLSLDECWHSFRIMRRDCAPIFRECLAFLEGALVRSAGLDGGICRTADALLDDLSRRTEIHWARLTILGEEEFLRQTAEIIRLRFPEFSIWNLPITGHEFGHLVAQESKERRSDGTYRFPFQEICQREGRKHVPFLHEHFADLFAVYSLGPAYACTFILLRSDPVEAHRDGREHPSRVKRVYFILKALGVMDKARRAVMLRYEPIIKHLDDVWQRSLVAAGQPKSLDEATREQLDDWLGEFYDVLLERGLPPRARYTDLGRAHSLSSKLLSGDEAEVVLQDEDTLTDVLNAAWLCRIDHWDEDSYLVQRIGKKAVELCDEIIRRTA